MANRLRVRIPELWQGNCFLGDQAEPLSWPADRQCVIIALGGGHFPEPFTAGGGALTLCELSKVDITAWIRCELDATPDLSVSLLGAAGGLWSYWQPAILRALMITEDDQGEMLAWDPRGLDGRCLLRNQLAPLHCTTARPDSTDTWLGITLTFAVDFDWWL